MRIVRNRCGNSKGYEHYWEKKGGDVSDVHEDSSWDREMLLVCARCGRTLYIDSVMRSYVGLPETGWEG